MKITVLKDKAVITNNSPVIMDMRGKATIEVGVPDSKSYVIGFFGKTSAKSAVKNGRAELPKCFFSEQTLETVVYRGDENGITTLPCEPIKIYKLANNDMFSLYVESAIGAKDVRDMAAKALIEAEELRSAYIKISEERKADAEKLAKLQDELSAFRELYNANIEKMNDIIRRVEIMEADYDVLVK